MTKLRNFNGSLGCLLPEAGNFSKAVILIPLRFRWTVPTREILKMAIYRGPVRIEKWSTITHLSLILTNSGQALEIGFFIKKSILIHPGGETLA
jgi:hypothetical protein